MGQRLFTIDMQAGVHDGGADGGMPMIGCGDDNRVERFFFFDESPVISVFRNAKRVLAMTLLGFGDLVGIDITESHDVVTELLDVITYIIITVEGATSPLRGLGSVHIKDHSSDLPQFNNARLTHLGVDRAVAPR